MIKLTGCLLIVVFTPAAGIFCSEKFRLRTVFYEQYLLFLTNAGTFISYTAASIGELLSMNISAPMIEPILKEAKHSLENGSEFSCAWRKAVDGNVSCKEDRELLYGFGDNFGTSDVEGELSKLGLHKELAERRLNELRDELKTKRKLYRVMGMFAGVLTAVVIY